MTARRFFMLFVSLSVGFLSTMAARGQLGMQGQGGITKTTPDGKTYKVDFYGGPVSDASAGERVLLSDSMLQGKGKYFLKEENLVVTSNKVTEVSDEAIAIQINGEEEVFTVISETELCDGAVSLKVSDFNVDDVVTVTSPLNEHFALSVRKGPMLFGGLMSSQLFLKKYACK